MDSSTNLPFLRSDWLRTRIRDIHKTQASAGTRNIALRKMATRAAGAQADSNKNSWAAAAALAGYTLFGAAAVAACESSNHRTSPNPDDPTDPMTVYAQMAIKKKLEELKKGDHQRLQATSPTEQRKNAQLEEQKAALVAAADAIPEMTASEWEIEKAKKKAKQHSGGLKLFSGNGNLALSLEICRHLGINLGKATVGRFADGEANIVVHENVRGKDCYVIQPTCPPVNDNIMELLLMVSTLRRASARRITVVIPYYGYARQDRKMQVRRWMVHGYTHFSARRRGGACNRSNEFVFSSRKFCLVVDSQICCIYIVQARVPISSADIARLIEAMGVDRVIAVDLHCGQIQGFFGPRVPVDNLDGGIVGLDYFGSKDLHNPVVVSPDAGGVYRAKKFKEGLMHKYDMQDIGLAMIVKQRARAGLVDTMDLVGDVKSCDCILVDDMIDTAGTLCKAADVLIENGARRVFAFASHGLLSGPGNDRLANSKMEEIVILNTIPTSPQREANEKLTTLSVAPLLAQAIFNIHAKKSISALFK